MPLAIDFDGVAFIGRWSAVEAVEFVCPMVERS